MNQISILRFINISLLPSGLSLVIFCLATSLTAIESYAQGNFDSQFPPISTSLGEQGNWKTPQSLPRHDPHSSVAGHQTPTWPDQTVTFDSQIQQASFGDNQSNNGSLESTIDSAGAAISNFKDTFASKAGGLLGSLTGKSGSPNISRMISSLAIVLGGYFGFVWLMRIVSPAANSQLPAEVLQVLGRTPFGMKQNLQLVRLGSKLVLLLNGPDGTQPIGEITEPAEVEYLTSLCNSKLNARSMGFARSRQQPIRQPAPPTANNDQGLGNVIRAIQNAAKQQNGGSVFEA